MVIRYLGVLKNSDGIPLITVMQRIFGVTWNVYDRVRTGMKISEKTRHVEITFSRRCSAAVPESRLIQSHTEHLRASLPSSGCVKTHTFTYSCYIL